MKFRPAVLVSQYSAVDLTAKVPDLDRETPASTSRGSGSTGWDPGIDKRRHAVSFGRLSGSQTDIMSYVDSFLIDKCRSAIDIRRVRAAIRRHGVPYQSIPDRHVETGCLHM
jgi:hypothetical protein